MPGNGKRYAREALRQLFGMNGIESEDGREVFNKVLEAHICPTQIPLLGVEDCIRLPDDASKWMTAHECKICWQKALGVKDGEDDFDMFS